MKKCILLVMFAFILLISVNMNVVAAQDPYTVYGTVKDVNGIETAGATVTIENRNTHEKSNVGSDTVTGSPIPVTTDSDGIYIFELINLKNGYSNGDEILVTAARDGMIGSKSVILDNGSWGAKVDITLEIEQEPKEKEEWHASLSNPLTLLLLLALIIAIIIILILARRGRGTEPEANRIGGPVGGGETGVESEDSRIGEPLVREEALGEEAGLEPEPKGGLIGGTVMGKEASNEIVGQEPEPVRQSSLVEDAVVYECPECGEEIKEEDTECANCGVSFAEADD